MDVINRNFAGGIPDLDENIRRVDDNPNFTGVQ
eukprot:gene9922-biopygen86